MWTNLIDNAIDAIGEHGTISMHTKNEGDDHILVEIVDSGSQGIPEDLKSRIFEPFFTTKDPGKDTASPSLVLFCAIAVWAQQQVFFVH